MTAAKDDATSKKDPIEVVEDYRDNLSNSRTAPGHHDGQEKKVKLLSYDVLDFSWIDDDILVLIVFPAVFWMYVRT